MNFNLNGVFGMYNQLNYPPFFNGFPYPYGNHMKIEPKKAMADIKGGPLAPNLKGIVMFNKVAGGTQVTVELTGLPEYKAATDGNNQIGPHGFHIHKNGTCEIGNPKEPFSGAGGHWNPTNQPHGNHDGDFPVLFSNNGYSRMSFFSNKFTVAQVIGKSVIIHEGPDDYKSQPSGASGRRLACGLISLI